MWNIKALAITIQMLSTRLKHSKSRPDSKSRSPGKNVGTHEEFLYSRILIWKIKSLALVDQKLLANYFFFKIKHQGQRSQGQNYWNMRKDLVSYKILMWNIKSYSIHCLKVINKDKVSDRFTEQQYDRMTNSCK